MDLEKLYENIENSVYDNGVPPRCEYNEKEVDRIKTTDIGTWVELQKKIDDYKYKNNKVWEEKKAAYYKVQREMNTQFEKDVIECYGVTGHIKSQQAFNMAREAGTVEEIIEQFGELSKLFKDE